jgi:pyruvate/2-oxoglutarate dehydrogenase complex dihydrolipoamide dehydrogenase (E3) component
MEYIPYIVIGAGAAGLVIANGLAKTKKPILLVERDHFGGDCTNCGCIPSKSLIASAHIAHNIKQAAQFGIDGVSPTFDAHNAFVRTKNIVESMRVQEEPEALAKHGVRSIYGIAEFIDAHSIRVLEKGGTEKCFRAKKIIIATGSSPVIPDIQGIFNIPYLTNETIFDLETVPKSIAFIGAGPIGTELAQAFSRLGSKVHMLLHGDHILSREDPEIQEIMEKKIEEEGITLHRNAYIPRVDFREKMFRLGGIQAEQLVVASGRKPNIERLNLEAAGIRFTERGIDADEYGRTSQGHIFAIGDVAGQPFFTHYAENQARSVLTSLLLPWNKKLSKQSIPRTTFTDPEVASIGLSENQARDKWR